MKAFDTWHLRSLGIASALLMVSSAEATSVPRISFEELTDKSEVVAEGTVVRTWAAWDPVHKHIWTNYELAVAATYKGESAASVTISEPGGLVGGVGEMVAGAVSYAPGDRVLVFLERMPNGYLRTTGWGQGQYRVDARGALHASESLKAESLTGAAAGLTSLEGLQVTEVTSRVTARVRARGNR